MASYKPIKIAGMETGLIQEREEFLLVKDAFPVLENAYIFREKILKKKGNEFFGRLRRVLTAQALTNTAASATYSDTDVLTTLTLRATEPNATIQCVGANAFTITIDPGGGSETVLSDTLGTGALTIGTNNLNATAGTINYQTGAISITFAAPIAGGLTVQATFAYYPGLPVMGLKSRELSAINSEELVAFDTKYAYTVIVTPTYPFSVWREFIAGTTWNSLDYDFFWSTNYWVNGNNNKLFWVTNFNIIGAGDPIRYTDGSTWTNFTPLYTSTNTIYQAKIILPFRGRLLFLNTWEGTTAGGFAGATQERQRIRWSQIGSPIQTDSWRKDIRGKGGFLDIPTSENIISAGFVRDNLVIYCERSTWQLRYTGRSISPFQIERVNSELGAESTFSAVQFDKTLVGIGDKRIVSCDSFESTPIDIKIPNFALRIENENNGNKRVHGIRDIEDRLVYWTYPSTNQGKYQGFFPNGVLVYNYENESWGILKDSITTFGYVWQTNDPTWEDLGNMTWEEAEMIWSGTQAQQPILVAGNQQGYIFKYANLTSNQQSLQIKDITGNTTTATTITSPNHNLRDKQIIKIINIPTGTSFVALNDINYYVNVIDADTFNLYLYDSNVDGWITPQLNATGSYPGCGEIVVIDNFSIQTKKFNAMEEGKKIQVGYLDCLVTATSVGKIAINTYFDYVPNEPINQNQDTFINTELLTGNTSLDPAPNTIRWRRFYCPTQAQFVQFEFTHSNSQLNDGTSLEDVTLHALILWQRNAGDINY